MAEEGATPRTPFIGFRGDEIEQYAELNSKLNIRKIKEIERVLEALVERVSGLEGAA